MSDLAATPGTVRLGGSDYKLSPATIADYGTMRERMIAEEIRAVIDVIPDSQQALRVECIDRIIKTSHQRWQSYSATPDGFLFGCYLGLARNHPDLTLERFQQLVSQEQSLDEFTQTWHRINQADIAHIGNGDEPDPTT